MHASDITNTKITVVSNYFSTRAERRKKKKKKKKKETDSRLKFHETSSIRCCVINRTLYKINAVIKVCL